MIDKHYLPHRLRVKKLPVIYINARFLGQTITGVQLYAREICRHLSQRESCRFVLIAPTGTLLPPEMSHLDFVTIGKTKGYSWEQIELPGYLKKRGSPLLINLCNTAPLLYKNQFVTIHDLAFLHHPEWFSKSFAAVYKFLIPRIAKRARKVITVSQTIKRQLINQMHIKQQDICVIGNGLQNDVLQSNAEGVKEKILFTVGSINPRKNLRTLIQAFELANPADYKLVICGAGNHVFGKEKMKVSTPNIIFAGYMDNATMITHYKKAEVFISLSLDEGFGIPVLEAAYFNCKLLLSDIEVYQELYGEMATFINPTDVMAVSNAISQLVQNHSTNNTANAPLLAAHTYKNSAAELLSLSDAFF